MTEILDLKELKAELDIGATDTSEDKKLLFYLDIASSWVEEYLDRPGLFYKVRTEFYRGTGTQQLLLKSRPVYINPTIQVIEDEQGYYGSPQGSFNPTTGALIYGQDFGLEIDQDDGMSSRCGILFRINNLWPRPSSRTNGLLSPFITKDFGSLKITYGGGYLVDNLPSQIRFAITLIVARMRILLPLGQVLLAESYEERAVQYTNPFEAGNAKAKEFIMGLARPILFSFRNWRF